MLQLDYLRGYDFGPATFLIDFGLVLLAGFLIGYERESKGKPASIKIHTFIIAGSMIFTYISAQSSFYLPHVDPSRIAAGLVTGVGFLGAGIILKSESAERITNLHTAAAIWFSASIGMAIGFNLYVIAIFAIAFAVFIPRMPNISKLINVKKKAISSS